jgi:hypothetical protein
MIRQPNHRDVERRSDERVAAVRSPEQLWAACLAEQPGLIADIVTFIESGRARLMVSPPLRPDTMARPEETSDGS